MLKQKLERDDDSKKKSSRSSGGKSVLACQGTRLTHEKHAALHLERVRALQKDGGVVGLAVLVVIETTCPLVRALRLHPRENVCACRDRHSGCRSSAGRFAGRWAP